MHFLLKLATLLVVTIGTRVYATAQSRGTATLPASPSGLPSSSEIIAHANSSASSGPCCAALSHFLGPKVSYSFDAAYIETLATYWSLQEASVKPKCVVEPKTTKDVSTAVFILSLLSKETRFSSECQFAIRGAGHTPFAGAANIQGGITINLAGLNEVNVAPDRTITGVGPGNNWGNVYTKLDALGLAVPGGRVAGVGVGGLTTGGGISFFSPQSGFVCDNVVNYEVVLAYGKIVNASATSNADLFRALKGGSNNFGIVTRFDLKTIQQGPFWGGEIGYDISTREQHFKAFEDFNAADPYDAYAALILNLAYINGSWYIANNYEYTKQPAQPYPATFQPFTSIQPQFVNTMRIAPLANFTFEIDVSTPIGKREIFTTFTFRNSATLMSEIFAIANSTLTPIASAPGLVYSISFQPIPPIITARALRTGGNSLGLDPADGPLVNTLLGIQWFDAADDGPIYAASRAFVRRATAAAAKRGRSHPYLYLNYAAEWQDPIRGYGEESVRRLRAVSRKVDPEGIFQRAVPGGFKLF